MGSLVSFKTRAVFDNFWEDSAIKESSLNFIQDTGQLYTHGIMFNSVLYGAENTNSIVLSVGGSTRTLSLSGHTHSNYHSNTANLDIATYKLVSGQSDLIQLIDGDIKIGNTTNPTYVYGQIKTSRDNSNYTVLDTGNFSILPQTISGNILSNVATFQYGSSKFQLDYIKRLNTVSAFDSITGYTCAGTTNVDNKVYGFITLKNDSDNLNPKYAQIRIDTTLNTFEYRSSGNTTWSTFLTGGSFRNLTINGNLYAIATTSSTLPTLYIPTQLGNPGQYLSVTNDGEDLVWRSISNNALGVSGIVAGPTAQQTRMVWKTDDEGNPGWRTELSYSADNNGLTLNNSNVFRLSLNSVVRNENAIGGKLYPIELDLNGKLAVYIPWENTWAIWQGATSQNNGVAGYMPAPTSAQANQFLRGDGTWVDLNNYTLPTASSSVKGGVLVGEELDSEVGYTPVHIKDGVLYYKDLNTTYNIFTAATDQQDGRFGLVPGPEANQLGTSGYFLRADATWVIPTNTQYYLTLNGIVNGNTGKVNLGTIYAPSEGGDGFLKCSISDDTITWTYDNTSYLPASNYPLYEVSTTITITADQWNDTDLSYSTVGLTTTGTYAIQISNNDRYYSGIMSWYAGDGSMADEVILHYSGSDDPGDSRLYLKTDNGKIYIAANETISSSTYTIKLRKLI